MCIIFLAYQVHPDYPIIMAANRDEFWSRPTEPAHYWPDAPDILAGRDRKAGGTWLGITRTGRVAAVTNYREWPFITAERSRGELVSRFLMSEDTPETYLKELVTRQDAYQGYNLLIGDVDGFYYQSNRLPEGKPRWQALKPGCYGLSNHLLDSPWFKVEKGRQQLQQLLQLPSVDPADLFQILADQEQAPDDRLPETGVGREREKALSSILITGTEYGTRSSTILLMNKEHAYFAERSHRPDYRSWTERSFAVPIQS